MLPLLCILIVSLMQPCMGQGGLLEIEHTPPVSATVNTNISITANILSERNGTVVRLIYENTDNSIGEANMTLSSGNMTEGVWSAVIPGQSAAGSIRYYINASYEGGYTLSETYQVVVYEEAGEESSGINKGIAVLGIVVISVLIMTEFLMKPQRILRKRRKEEEETGEKDEMKDEEDTKKTDSDKDEEEGRE